MIKLIYDLVVDVNQYNYILMVDKHKQDKKGKQMYEIRGYFSTLEHAICGAKDYCVKKHLSENTYDLSEAIDIIKRVTDEFSDLLKERLGE